MKTFVAKLRDSYIRKIENILRRVLAANGNAVEVDKEVTLTDIDDLTDEVCLLPFRLRTVSVAVDNSVLVAISYVGGNQWNGAKESDIFNQPFRDFSSDDCEKMLELVLASV